MLPWVEITHTRWGCRQEKAEPLLVEAVLEAPIALDPQYHIALDGVMQWVVVADAAGMQPFEAFAGYSGPAPDIGLPVATRELAGVKVYCVSDGVPSHTQGLVRYQRRRARIDRLGLDQVNTSTAEYKSIQVPNQSTLAWSVSWHCRGDRERLVLLLDRCHSLGRNRAGGMGLVHGWRVSAAAQDHSFVAADGQPARRFPVRSRLAAEGIFGRGVATGLVSVRPPYYMRASATLCALPPWRGAC